MIAAAIAPSAARASDEGPASAPTQGASAPEQVLPPVATTGQRVRDPAWISYRDSYRAMEMYLGSARADEPLEPRFYLRPLRADAPPSAELRLALSGTAFDREIPLEHHWGTVPHDPQALAAHADFTLDAPPGSFRLVRTLGIKRLPGGVYPERYLRDACDRWLAVMRDMHLAYKVQYAFKTCAGARFLVPAGDGQQVLVGALPAERERPKGLEHPELEFVMVRFSHAPDTTVQVKGPLIAVLPMLD